MSERPIPSADATTTEDPRWEPTLALEELTPGELHTFKGFGKQLVLGRTVDLEVFALDNRCPHEGYPLASGTLKDCALTCCWHNWKFDVRDGSCVLGGEPVRHYGTRVVDGVVEVDVADPDPRGFFPEWLRSFEEGLFERDNARAIRDGVRLVGAGYGPERLLARVAIHDARHAEYGTTHALAVCADAARFLDRYEGERSLYAIAPAIDMCSDANVRLPERASPAPMPGADERALREAVESEEAARAEGLLLGAFDADVPLAEIDRWMFAVLSDHFLSFGHPLIYFVKAQELVARAAEARRERRELARELYPALLYGTVLGTREDSLPYMSGYSKRFAAIEPELPALHAAMDAERPFDPAALVDVILDGDRGAAFGALHDACRSGVDAPRIAQALVVAAARRLQRFDPAIDADGELAENWLWATHRFTFASAVRNAVERFDSPDALRFLFQGLAFIHSGHRMDLAPGARHAVAPRPMEPARVLDAILARDAIGAMEGTLHVLERGDPGDELRHGLEDLTLNDPLVRPIAVAHAIKTLVAAFEEHDVLRARHPLGRGDTLAADPVLGAVRFLASPFQERRVHQTVGTSIRWVAEGVLPRKLTQ